MFRTKLVDKITHLMFNNFFSENRSADNSAIRRMRFAWWVTKVTDTFGLCDIYCVSMATGVTRTLLIVALYVHCLSCINSQTHEVRSIALLPHPCLLFTCARMSWTCRNRDMMITLKSSGHCMYHQLNTINSTFCPHSVFMCLCGSENRQRLFPYTALTDWFV